MEGDPPNWTTPLFSVPEAKIDNNKNLKSIEVTAALQGNTGLQQLQLSSPQGSCIPLPPCQKAASPHRTPGQQREPSPPDTSPPLHHLQEQQKAGQASVLAFPFATGNTGVLVLRAACDYSKALQVITQLQRLQQLWKLLINSPQLLCPLHSS